MTPFTSYELDGRGRDTRRADPLPVAEACRCLSRAYSEADLWNPDDPLAEFVYICLTRQTHQKNASRAWDEFFAAGGVRALRNLTEDLLMERLRRFGLVNQKVRWLRSAFDIIVATFGDLTLDPFPDMPNEDAETFPAASQASTSRRCSA